MPSWNPFLHLKAYGSSDEDDLKEQAPGVDDKGGASSEEEIGEGEIEEEEEEAGALKNNGEFKDEEPLNRYLALHFLTAWNNDTTWQP
ncbi:hypothetical protein VKT23_016656 [Stygiomarasmius scandens]|uniref:Uncharacterized protein n=1 Tax=Marasmiellus scandens TaxID=2682957 RepID=A0ABR1IX35_9AGAR